MCLNHRLILLNSAIFFRFAYSRRFQGLSPPGGAKKKEALGITLILLSLLSLNPLVLQVATLIEAGQDNQ